MKKAKFTNDQMLSALHRRADALIAAGKFSTGSNHASAAASFALFLHSAERMGARRFDAATVRAYDAWLLHVRGISRNSSSFYQRILRATLVASGGDASLFDDVFTGVEGTRKRAVPEDVIARLAGLELRGTQEFCRDLFLFSIAARGMAFVDMAYLLKSDISGGYIRYVRRKTGRPLSIRIEPCMEALIEKWRSPDRSPFVFPLISRTGAEGFREFRSGRTLYNLSLKALGAQVGCAGLSSYVARHTWATLAFRAGLPLSTISEGMGHGSERTTRIYLASLAPSAVDRANRLVLQKAGLASGTPPHHDKKEGNPLKSKEFPFCTPEANRTPIVGTGIRNSIH